MINYLAFLICLNAMPWNQAPCSTAIKAFSIQSGLQVYGDAGDKMVQDYAKRNLASVDDRVLGSLYLIYQFQFQDRISIPIPWHPFSDAMSLYGSHHSLGVSLTWVY